jgi:uncharacterized membrane protein
MMSMNTLLLNLLQCGAFLLIPIGTFAVGIWFIVRFVGMNNRWSPVLIALLIGFVFFEASTIGMLIDPRGGLQKIPQIIKTSTVIGVITSLCVLIFLPIFRALMKLFRQN